MSRGPLANAGAGLASLYRDAIRRHAVHPVGYRQKIGATHRHEEFNPLCGDRIELSLRVEAETVAAAAFDGEACAICMASASLLCGLAPSLTVTELRELGDQLQEALQQPIPPGLPEELQPLLGVRPYPSRIQCATLPWTAALNALRGESPG